MLQSVLAQTKIIRVLMFALIFVLMCTMFLVGDSLVAKLNYRRHVSLCGWCPFELNNTIERKSLPIHLRLMYTDGPHDNIIHVLLVFANVNENQEFGNKLSVCLSSLFFHSTLPLHLHILTDVDSLKTALHSLQKASTFAKTPTQITLHDVTNITKPLEELVVRMRPHFSFKRGAYYSNALFFISIGLYKVLPQQKIIVIDIDVKFLADIKELYAHFNKFSQDAMIGIAREQQPVYRHVMNEYRRLHNNTKAGDPPPDGLTGFNSGVLLLDLEKMKNSTLYSKIVDNSSVILELVSKYKFKGHLGDQDFYSLVSLDYNKLFYVLPCTWNRQLCQWWKSHGYADVFDQYHMCSGKINLLHGNCNTFLTNVPS